MIEVPRRALRGGSEHGLTWSSFARHDVLLESIAQECTFLCQLVADATQHVVLNRSKHMLRVEYEVEPNNRPPNSIPSFRWRVIEGVERLASTFT